jgi:integrase
MTTPSFHSALAPVIAELVTLKRLEGYDYTAQAVFLRYFDGFLCTQGYEKTSLSRQIVEAYIAHTAHLAPNGRYSRLSTVRVLSRHLHQSEPKSYVLHELPVERPTLPRFYLYSKGEIVRLIEHARTIGSTGSLRPHCFAMLIGLLSVTGLRIAEALALNLDDVDRTGGLVFVRKGKLGKQRYVVLDQSTVQAVGRYLGTRATYESSAGRAPFFLTSAGRRLEYREAAATFRRITTACEVGGDAPQPPRLHDLRHTYACSCLLTWYDQGANVTSKLPILATAMGHVNVASTQIYLHVTSRLLEQATQRFRPTFTANCKGGGRQ